MQTGKARHTKRRYLYFNYIPLPGVAAELPEFSDLFLFFLVLFEVSVDNCHSEEDTSS